MDETEGIDELDTVVLLKDIEEEGLERGDTGAVVHRHDNADACEVEFVTGEGDTVGLLTLGFDDIRPMGRREILHARTLAG